MTTQEIIAKAVRSEDYVSSRSFGGKFGKMYFFKNPELSFFRGTLDYRHAPSERVQIFYYQGRGIEQGEWIEMLKES